jgi:hypothetical protein
MWTESWERWVQGVTTKGHVRHVMRNGPETLLLELHRKPRGSLGLLVGRVSAPSTVVTVTQKIFVRVAI